VYKAVHRLSGEEILTLHPAWRGRQDELRQLTGQEMLVCQGCRQAVRLKAGPRKRPHFAHRHLQGCSYGQESPRVLAARAILYEWLADSCPGKVKAEVSLPGLPRPADVVLDDGGTVYWVTDTLMKQEMRSRLRSAFDQAGYQPVWILLSNLLRPDAYQTPASARHPNRIYLSPCERDCMRQTIYDEIGRENHLLGSDFGSSLHYLDVDEGKLITLRSLERVHAPNIYVGRREEHTLDKVLVDLDGEPVHPGEERDLENSRRMRKRQVERVKLWLEPAPRSVQLSLGVDISAGVPREAREKVTCIYCGETTDDWWAVWVEDGERLGKCRACLDKGFG
jgi:hypothetical protein